MFFQKGRHKINLSKNKPAIVTRNIQKTRPVREIFFSYIQHLYSTYNSDIPAEQKLNDNSIYACA